MSGTEAQVGYKPMVLGVADLGWEAAKTFNIGLDFGLFKDRITATIDWYRKNTFDLLLEQKHLGNPWIDWKLQKPMTGSILLLHRI